MRESRLGKNKKGLAAHALEKPIKERPRVVCRVQVIVS
jgi:hypothetical protein